MTQPRRIEKTETQEPEPAPITFPIYREGGAAIANESAMNAARMQLRNVKEVSLTGGGPLLLRELAGVLDDNGIAVVDGADVVIHFEGRLDRGGRGRRRRSADATITRNGRPVLRYLMPPEEYRMGDNPAEAFGRILSDLLER